MNLLQAILLGLLQGLTEFLPVSSSGHLVIARAVMDIQDIPLLFDVILHLATLVVVIWFFRRSLAEILAAIWRLIVKKGQEEDARYLMLALKLAAASVITAIIGLGVMQFLTRNNPQSVAVLFMITALLLLSTLFLRGSKHLNGMGWFGALFIGVAQGFGVLPGISRSGITLVSGLMAGFDRRAAAEFSFLLSIPAVAGAFLFSLKDAAALGSRVAALPLLAGFAAALLAGYASLRLLLWLFEGGKLWVFAIYLLPLGSWALIRFAF